MGCTIFFSFGLQLILIQHIFRHAVSASQQVECWDPADGGANYRGTVATTTNGLTCQSWDSQLPHNHANSPGEKPNSGLQSNYCRNPDGWASPWCYTTDPTKRWEICDIPTCLTECASVGDKGAGYRGSVATTVSGLRCQQWGSQSPHAHTNTPEDRPFSDLRENYCRNPDGSDKPWCYTTDPDVRWQYCSIPPCTKTCTFEPVKPPRYDMTVTVSGRSCQAWSSQYPHEHTRTPEKYPDGDLTANYCRNPDGEIGLWCYTTDQAVRWELCAIPACRNDCWDSADLGSTYRGSVSKTETGKNCQKWIRQEPHKHTNTALNKPGSGLDANYCRNPDREQRPWCYTKDKSSRWEYCPIPKCNKDILTACWAESDDGRSYRGHAATTITGRKCQKWAAQQPHGHNYTRVRFLNAGLDENYCRNPDEDGTTPWCYTTDDSVRWEYCAVPSCNKGCTMGPQPPAVDHDRISKTITGRTCQAWSSQFPHQHTRDQRHYPGARLVGNYCRNPDGESGPWCYTTDPAVRWELCAISECATQCWHGELKATTYRGTASQTVSGKTCQPWDSQLPHAHKWIPSENPNLGLEENYCRNPDESAAPWCYTNDEGTRWEFCSVPRCESAECMTTADKGASYRGAVSTTKTGKTCQEWILQHPHSHTRYPSRYPNDGLIHNYCRNPDNSDSPWCYTTDDATRWEYCDVPVCTVDCRNGNDQGATYRGHTAMTENGKTCQQWSLQYPHSHTRTPANYPGSGLEANYCRNPDGENRPWCYTTSSSHRWEYCAIPICE